MTCRNVGNNQVVIFVFEKAHRKGENESSPQPNKQL